MQAYISRLVGRYDSGLLTRRDLIQALAMLTGIGAAGASVSLEAAAPFQTADIDHVSLQVKDVHKSAAFYKNVFGLATLDEDEPNKTIRLRVGTASRIVLREVNPPGVVDHVCLAVAKLDKAVANAQLRQIGVTSVEKPDYRVIDPDGYPVQIVQAGNR
jgi:hypothetical protein